MTRRNPGVVLRGDRNECPGCNELFNSTAAFDRHRTGKFGLASGDPRGRRCMTVAEMLAKGMAKNADGFWVTKLRDENAPRRSSPDAGSHDLGENHAT